MKVKVDASGADDKEKSGLSSDSCNCVKLYVLPDLTKEAKRISQASEITGKESVIFKDFQDLIATIFGLTGVNFLWVYPNAIQIHKKVVADWKTAEQDGVFNLACQALEKDFKRRFGEKLDIKFIKGCAFPTDI